MSYRNVVVGTDGSETAETAVGEAAQLAAAFDARLTVVTAYSENTPAEERELSGVPDEIRWRVTDAGGAEDIAARAKSLARDAGVKEIKTRVASGDAADALVEAAEDTGADVIVVGSKGMASASRFLLGSVPNKVSHHAPCDVLIVHTAS